MNMLRVWPIVCEFGIGAILCLIGIFGGLRGGYLNLKTREDRRLRKEVLLSRRTLWLGPAMLLPTDGPLHKEFYELSDQFLRRDLWFNGIP